MSNEFEIVSHSQFRHLNVFLVRMLSRTTHIHRELELGMVLDGSMTVQSGPNSQVLRKGEIYLINPMDAHEFVSEGKGALVLSIQLSPDFMKAFLSDVPHICFLCAPKIQEHYQVHQGAYDFLSLLFIELAYNYFGHEENHEFKCCSLVMQLFCNLKTHIPNKTLSSEDYLSLKQKTDRIFSVTDYIDHNFTRKLLLEDIAQREQLSMHYLSHLFRDALGISFQDYLKEKRFEYAFNLISTTQRTILDISLSSGFSDVRYLNQMFQERFACTPKEYRKGAYVPVKKADSPITSTQSFFTPQESLQLITPFYTKIVQKMSNVKLAQLL